MRQINGLKLRAWRKAQRRSLEAVARDLGISFTTLHRWETGKYKAGISELGYRALQKLGYQE